MECLTKCQICYTPFDRNQRRPLVMPECGHTLCEPCALILKFQDNKKEPESLIKKAISIMNMSISCPFCDQRSFLEWEASNDSLSLGIRFVPNKQIMEYLETVDKHAEHRKLCVKHSCPIFWRCVYPKCKDDDLLCIKCLEGHEKCYFKYICPIIACDFDDLCAQIAFSVESALQHINEAQVIVVEAVCKEINDLFKDIRLQINAAHQILFERCNKPWRSKNFDNLLEELIIHRRKKTVAQHLNIPQLQSVLTVDDLVDFLSENIFEQRIWNQISLKIRDLKSQIADIFYPTAQGSESFSVSDEDLEEPKIGWGSKY